LAPCRYPLTRSSSLLRLYAASKEIVIITKRKGLAAAGVVALIAAGSAACGTAQTTPQGKVQNAFAKLSEQKSVTLGMSFDATPDQIYAALKSGDFSMDNAKTMASLHATVAASSSQQFGLLASKPQAGKGGAFGIALTSDLTGKNALFDVRSVGQKLYLRADLKAFQKLDTSADSAGQFAALNSFLDQADKLPSSLSAVKAALKGQWVVIDPKQWADFAKSMADKYSGSSDSSSSDSQTLQNLLDGKGPIDPQTEKQLLTALKTAFTHNVTYKDLGSKDGADHVQVSVPERQLATELSTSLPPILKQLPGVTDSDLADMKDVSGVPNRNIDVDVAIKGGDVAGITFDVLQLNDKPHTGTLPFHLTLDDSTDSLTAPQGAQEVKPQDLTGLFMSMSPDDSSSGSSDSSSSDSSDFSDSSF
jgi:hypothetical protein